MLPPALPGGKRPLWLGEENMSTDESVISTVAVVF